MARSPRINIDLDPGPWANAELRDYRLAGGEIGGRVVVHVDEPLACRGLVTRIGWHTEGRGERDEEEVFHQTLHHGDLSSGQFSFPFTAKLPISPVSYAGHYLTIVWRVEARIDVARRRDPITEKVFYVMPKTAAATC